MEKRPFRLAAAHLGRVHAAPRGRAGLTGQTLRILEASLWNLQVKIPVPTWVFRLSALYMKVK